MFQPRIVTENFAVSPQIHVEHCADLAQLGYQLVICNRPDHEDADQPTALQIQSAAEQAGMAFVHLPIAGGFSGETLDQMTAWLAKYPKVFAYCRSGTRSVTAWALAQRGQGAKNAQNLLSAAANAGYNLGHLAQVLA